MATSACILKCRERLERAEEAVALMQAATTLKMAERGWSEFLLAASAIYSKLEEGTKGDGKHATWFGGVKKERKDDHLLRYIHHARNSDEHSIDDITATNDQSYILHPVKSEQKGVREFRVETRDQPCWVLIPVKDSRFGDTFDPPGWHMGECLIDESPLNVAKVGLRYLKALVDVAECLGV